MQPLVSHGGCSQQLYATQQNSIQQLGKSAPACRHGRTTQVHSSRCTATLQPLVAAGVASEKTCLTSSVFSLARSNGCSSSHTSRRTICSASSSAAHNITSNPLLSQYSDTLRLQHREHETDYQQNKLQQRQQQQQVQPPSAADVQVPQGPAAEQFQMLQALVETYCSSSSSNINSRQPRQQQQQQHMGDGLQQWCHRMLPHLQNLPLPALATITVCLGQQQQQQQQQQQRSHFVTEVDFLHAYCIAVEAAAAAAAAAGESHRRCLFQQQWAAVQQQQQQLHRYSTQQQHMEQISAIVHWATHQLIQQQHRHWQQQQQHWQQRQQQQHTQQVQLHLAIRGHILQILQAAVSSRLLPSATSSILQDLLLCYGRLGVAVDAAWMGKWLAAARHVITDMTVTVNTQQQQQQQQEEAAAVYVELAGLLHSLAVAKVKPPEAWLLMWQSAGITVIQATPDFGSGSSSSSSSTKSSLLSGQSAAAAAAAGGQHGIYLPAVHQLLHAVSLLKLKFSSDYWTAHEGLVQQQVLGSSPQELLLLLQTYQQCRMKPSAVCIKYTTAQLSRHIHHCWQQQQQPGDGSNSSSRDLVDVCMCVCALAAWGTRLNITSTCEMLVCLAADAAVLPLPWLIQVLFTLGPRLGLIGNSGSSSGESSSNSEEAVTATAAAAAAVQQLTQYAADNLAAQQQWQQVPSSSSSDQHVRQLLQLLQLAAHLPRNMLRDTPLMMSLHDMAAAAAPVCSIPDLVQLMTHWTQLGFSSAWRKSGLRRGFRRLGQPGAFRGLSNADLAAAVVAAAKLPPLQRVVLQLAGEVSARLAQQQQQQQQGFTPGQLVDLVTAVPPLAAYWPPDQVLLLLLHIEGLEQQGVLNPADQWRVWSALQQLQQYWKPSVAAVAAAAAAASVHPGLSVDGGSDAEASAAAAAAGCSVHMAAAAAPLHVDVLNPQQINAAVAAAGYHGGSSDNTSSQEQQYYGPEQQRQQQQQLVHLLARLQQQVATSLSTAAPVVLPLDAAPTKALRADRRVQPPELESVDVPAAWVREQQQQQGELTVQQLLQHLAKAHKALQSPKCSSAGLTRVCEGLARLLAVARFSNAVSKVPTARLGVLRAIEASAWLDLESKTPDGHQLLLLLRVCHGLGSREDGPYMQKLNQAAVEALVTLPGKDLAAMLGKTAAVHLPGFCRCWEVVLLRVWVGRVQQLASQHPEEAVGVVVPVVKLGFRPAPAAAALVLLPLLKSTTAAASSGYADQQQQQQGLSAKGVLLLTQALVDLNLRPEPQIAELLLTCQITNMTCYNIPQLLQLGHLDLQLGLLGGPVGGLGVWRDVGVLHADVAVWIKAWLETLCFRGFRQMNTSQVVEMQLLLSEIDLMPVHNSPLSHCIFRLQQQLQAAAAEAGSSSSSSSRWLEWQQALAAAMQASYQTNRSAREAAAAAVRRRSRKHYRSAAVAAAAEEGSDLDSDDEYVSSSSLGWAAVTGSITIRRTGAATASMFAATSSSSPGFYYPADPKALQLYQLQQQRCALLWTAVKFRVFKFTEPWVTSCVSIFQRRLGGLPPLVTLGLLAAATEASKTAAAAAAAASSSGEDQAEADQVDRARRCAFEVLSAAVADRVLELVVRMKGEMLVQAVSGLAAYAAANNTLQQQQLKDSRQLAMFVLNQRQQATLLTVILRQLPYIEPAQLPVLIRSMSSLPVRPDSLTAYKNRPEDLAVQPETLRPSARWLVTACQVLAVKATSAEAAADPAQQLLLLAAARQLMALQQDGSNSHAAAPVAAVQVAAAQQVVPAVTPSLEVSPQVPAKSLQVPPAKSSGLGPLVTRVVGAAGLQVLASLVQQIRGGSQRRRQQQQRWRQRWQQQQQSQPASTPVAATLSGLAAQIMAWSETVVLQEKQQQHGQAAAAGAGTTSSIRKASQQQQQQLAALAVLLGMATDAPTAISSSGSSSGDDVLAWQRAQEQRRQQWQQQQQQTGFSGPGQQQLLGMLLRMELQQALTPQLSAAAVGLAATVAIGEADVVAAAAAAAGSNPDPEITAGAADRSKVSRQVASRGLQVKFDGLLRWALKAAAMGQQQQQQQQAAIQSSHRSYFEAGSSSNLVVDSDQGQPESAAADRRGVDSSSNDSSIVILPVMSRALDVQFTRLLRKVLQCNLASQGSSK